MVLNFGKLAEMDYCTWLEIRSALKSTGDSNSSLAANLYEKSNMSDLLEGIPYQPIDDSEENKKYWMDIALPLVRKIFSEMINSELTRFQQNARMSSSEKHKIKLWLYLFGSSSLVSFCPALHLFRCQSLAGFLIYAPYGLVCQWLHLFPASSFLLPLPPLWGCARGFGFIWAWCASYGLFRSFITPPAPRHEQFIAIKKRHTIGGRRYVHNGKVCMPRRSFGSHTLAE